MVEACEKRGIEVRKRGWVPEEIIRSRDRAWMSKLESQYVDFTVEGIFEEGVNGEDGEDGSLAVAKMLEMIHGITSRDE